MVQLSEHEAHRLGRVMTPLPLVGRAIDSSMVEDLLGALPTTVVIGPRGIGKTQMLESLCQTFAERGAQTVYFPVNRSWSYQGLCSALERRLGLFAGGLWPAMREREILIALDDLDTLTFHEWQTFLLASTAELGIGRVLASVSSASPFPRLGEECGRHALSLFDKSSALTLWHELGARLADKTTPAVQAPEFLQATPSDVVRGFVSAHFGAAALDVSSVGNMAQEILFTMVLLGDPLPLKAMNVLFGAESGWLEPLSDLLQKYFIASDGQNLRIQVQAREQIIGLHGKLKVRCEKRLGDCLTRPDARELAGIDVTTAAWTLSQMSDVATGDMLQWFGQLSQSGAGSEITDILRTRDDSEALRREVAELCWRRGHISSAQKQGGVGSPVEQHRMLARSGLILPAQKKLLELAKAATPESGWALAEAAILGRAISGSGDLPGLVEIEKAEQNQIAKARLRFAIAALTYDQNQIGEAEWWLTQSLAISHDNLPLVLEAQAAHARCLMHLGRLAEAEQEISDAERMTKSCDAGLAWGDLVRTKARLWAHTNRMRPAVGILRSELARLRENGDEWSALRCQLDLSQLLLRCGDITAAVSYAEPATVECASRGLAAWGHEGTVVLIGADLARLRVESAESSVAKLLKSSEISPRVRAVTLRYKDWLGALGEASLQLEGIEPELACYVALVRGDLPLAFDRANEWLEQVLRRDDVFSAASTLAVMARLHLARGQFEEARLAATRAARDAATGGNERAHIHALLGLGAVAHEKGEAKIALAYLEDAKIASEKKGLTVERWISEKIFAILRGDAQEPSIAALLSGLAREVGTAFVADLGFTSARPYVLVSSDGKETRVADARTSRLGVENRDLVIDGINEIILRRGQTVADLRRRSLLKKILFLLAAHPAKIYSKEAIVQSVWGIEYHPLRHDAALFTNIMRIRRLLGPDGADVIRANEEGYRFMPGEDFLFISPASE